MDEDRRAQDVARYTNVTYDPDLHLNPGALIWDKTVEVKEEITINPDTANYTIPITDMDERLRIILSWTEGGFRRGSRNGYVYDTTCNLCEYGIGKDEALDILLPYASSDFTAGEIRYTVGNAYRNKRFGSKTLRREGADERLKALFSKVKNISSFYHLPNPTMEYRPDMRIVIVDDDDVTEGMMTTTNFSQKTDQNEKDFIFSSFVFDACWQHLCAKGKTSNRVRIKLWSRN